MNERERIRLANRPAQSVRVGPDDFIEGWLRKEYLEPFIWIKPHIAEGTKLIFYTLSGTIPKSRLFWGIAMPTSFDNSQDDPASESIEARPIEPDIVSAHNIQMVKDWLTECLENHEHCPGSVHTEPGMLPTRVIDVSMAYPDENPKSLLATVSGLRTLR